MEDKELEKGLGEILAGAAGLTGEGFVAKQAEKLVHAGVNKVRGRMPAKDEVEHTYIKSKVSKVPQGHIYQMKGDDGKPRAFTAFHSSEKSLHLIHTPGEGGPKQHRVLSHEEFAQGVKNKSIHDLGGPTDEWFGKHKSEDDSEGEVIEKSDTLSDSSFPFEGIDPLEKSDIAMLASHLATHGPMIVQHAQALAEHAGHIISHVAEHHAEIGEALHHVAERGTEHVREQGAELGKFGVRTGGAELARAAVQGVGIKVAHDAIKGGMKAIGHSQNSTVSKHVKGSVEVGHHYLYKGKQYHAASSDNDGAQLDPVGKGTHKPMYMSHKEIQSHLASREGRMEEVEVPHHARNAEKSESFGDETMVKSQQDEEADVLPVVATEPTGYQPTIGDSIIDHNAAVFILKSIDRGIYTIERNERPVAAMNERDYQRFVTVPGMKVRRLGKQISAS